MPPFGPIKRRDLIGYFQQLGFGEPESGGKHQIMTRGNISILVPNLHQGDISKELLGRLLRRAGISKEEWGKALELLLCQKDFILTKAAEE